MFASIGSRYSDAFDLQAIQRLSSAKANAANLELTSHTLVCSLRRTLLQFFLDWNIYNYMYIMKIYNTYDICLIICVFLLQECGRNCQVRTSFKPGRCLPAGGAVLILGMPRGLVAHRRYHLDGLKPKLLQTSH